MFDNRTGNNKINKINERCLRLTYNNKKSSFKNLLDKDKSVSIHHKNLRSLGIEMCNVHRGISPAILNDFFPFKASLPI